MKAIVIIYSGRSITEIERYNLATIFAEKGIAKDDTVETFEFEDDEIAKMFVESELNNAQQSKKRAFVITDEVKNAVTFIRERYKKLIEEKDDTRFVIQLLTDIYSAEDKELIKNAMIILAEHKIDDQIYATGLPKRILNGIRLIYKNHLV